MVPYLASMLRNGTLKKAIQVMCEHDVQIELGKKLGSKCRRMLNLSRRFKRDITKLVMTLVPQGQEPPAILDEDAQADEEQKWKDLEDEDVNNIFNYAFGASDHVDLPSQHCHSSYEGPLTCVLIERYKFCKYRMFNFDVDSIRQWGYFDYPCKGQPSTKVYCTLSGTYAEVMYKDDVMDAANEWTIVNNMSMRAQLYSNVLNARVDLAPLFKRAGVKIPDVEAEFEYPDAAERFKGVNVPELDATPESSPSGSRTKDDTLALPWPLADALGPAPSPRAILPANK